MHNYSFSDNEKPGHSHQVRVTTPIPEGKFVAESRILSRMLVTMLVVELQDFDAAAKVVSGIEDVFSRYTRLIDDAIVQVDKQLAGSSFNAQLKPILDIAREEVCVNQKLEMDILAKLPDDASALSLRRAFRDAALARARLLQTIMMAPDRWLSAQAKACRVSTDTAARRIPD